MPRKKPTEQVPTPTADPDPSSPPAGSGASMAEAGSESTGCTAGSPDGAFRETDLYPPVRDFLTRLGFTVRGEVADCDVTAVRGDELVVVELKRSVTVPLLAQAVRRQRAAESVYVAVPRPRGRSAGRTLRDLRVLLRRLELGLLLVSFPEGRRDGGTAEAVLHPMEPVLRRDRKKRRAILREIDGRSGDFNPGGSSRRKLLTAYREEAIRIACCLDAFGPLSPKRLRELGTGVKTSSILRRNVYGWFRRIEKGLYGLDPAGRSALDEYPEVSEPYRGRLSAGVPPASTS